MKRKIKYTNEPMGELRAVKDFLPPPKELVLREDAVKVTMFLSKSSFDFFKKEAKRQGVPYQRMIRRILDLYAEHYQ